MKIIYLHSAGNGLESVLIATEKDISIRGHHLYIQWSQVTDKPKAQENAIPPGTVKIFIEDQTDEYIAAEISRISKHTIFKSELRAYAILEEKPSEC